MVAREKTLEVYSLADLTEVTLASLDLDFDLPSGFGVQSVYAG